MVFKIDRSIKIWPRCKLPKQTIVVHTKAFSSVQSWLQRFAWTEQNLVKRVVRRNAIPKDETLLRDEPMFCFETAVKMLYWSAFVYELDEVSAEQ